MSQTSHNEPSKVDAGELQAGTPASFCNPKSAHTRRGRGPHAHIAQRYAGAPWNLRHARTLRVRRHHPAGCMLRLVAQLSAEESTTAEQDAAQELFRPVAPLEPG